MEALPGALGVGRSLLLPSQGSLPHLPLFIWNLLPPPLVKLLFSRHEVTKGPSVRILILLGLLNGFHQCLERQKALLEQAILQAWGQSPAALRSSYPLGTILSCPLTSCLVCSKPSQGQQKENILFFKITHSLGSQYLTAAFCLKFTYIFWLY